MLRHEVTFEPVDYEFKSVYSFNPWHALINTFKPGTYDDTETTLTETSRGREYRNLLSSDHVSYKGKGWFAKRYEYDRIEKASDFIANESLEPVFEERLQGMQYVLRYAETEFTAVNNTGGSTGSTISFSSGTKMKDTAVLALTFETDEQIHNVGVVGDMRTEDPDPGNTDTNDYNFDITDPDVFPVWARVLVVFIVIIVILILIAVFAPQVLPPLFHGVGVVVSAPFKLIGAAVQSAKKASEARKERKEELEAEKDREEARKERRERRKQREAERAERTARKLGKNAGNVGNSARRSEQNGSGRLTMKKPNGNNNGKHSPRKCTSEAQKYMIKKTYAIRAAKEKTEQSNVGKVFRGRTKYIDKEPKLERDYAVVRETERGVTVAKLKSIKKFDENGKNADRALVEINHERYGLPNRTGVDFQQFDTNRMSGKPLKLADKDVFPENKERFTLSHKDRDKAVYHTGVKKHSKPKK